MAGVQSISSLKIGFVHGFLGLPADWGQVKSELARISSDKVECVSFDLWDIFKQLQPQASFTDCGEHLATAFESIRPDIVVGYSLGGRLLAQIPWEEFASVKSVCMLSSRLVSLNPEAKEKRLARDLIWSEKFLSRSWEQLLSEWNNQEVFQEDLLRSERKEADYDRGALATTMVNWSPAKQPDLITKVEPWQGKALWCYGEKDQLYARQAAELRTLLPGLSQHCFNGSGHGMVFTHPEQVAHLLLSLQTVT